jgi:hypothetical protein
VNEEVINFVHEVILPLTTLRRLDCVTERNQEAVLERYEQLQEQGIENIAPSLKKAADAQVYNTCIERDRRWAARLDSCLGHNKMESTPIVTLPSGALLSCGSALFEAHSIRALETE